MTIQRLGYFSERLASLNRHGCMSKTIKQFGDSGVWRGWSELAGDVNWEDYGGKWGRQDPNDSNVFYVIKHDNMIDCMGERDVESSGCDVHVSQVVRVDLSETSEESIAGALECCGVDLEEYDIPEKAQAWVKVECLVDYGAAAPMGEHTHPHRADVARANARREVEELIADADQLAAMLDRPVNGLGATAREYAAGDMSSAIERGVQAGKPESRIVAKMYGVDQFAIDNSKPTDFLPFVMGYMEAMNEGKRSIEEDLAPEYGLGFDRGERVRKGEVPAPSWIRSA